MNVIKEIAPLFILLFICTLDGYSMMSYRLPTKRAYACFAAITVFCLAVNSYIAVLFGADYLKKVIFFTIGFPYFVLILFITKNKISQTVFNFWLWINVYEIITGLCEFVNNFTLRSHFFLTLIEFILLCIYFFVYNKILKKKHKQIMETLEINWNIFSLIPFLFTVLIYLTNRFFHNYLLLCTIYALMLSVYILIFYTFKTALDSMERKRLADSLKEQISLQKKQHEMYLKSSETERIFRHDARHRDALILNCLQQGDTDGAVKLLEKEMTTLKSHNTVFCENTLINAAITEYMQKAQKNGFDFRAVIMLPKSLGIDESEFCVMLSNLLENSCESAKSYIKAEIKYLNSQISVNIKNDYEHNLEKDENGNYITTKTHGTGLGLKSVGAIAKKNSGFCNIEDSDGVFNVFVTLCTQKLKPDMV